MSTLRDAPLRTDVTEQSRNRFVRPWHLYFKRITERLQELFPDQETTTGIVWDDLQIPANAVASGSTNIPAWSQLIAATTASAASYFPLTYFPETTPTTYTFFPRIYFPEGTGLGGSSNGIYTWFFEDQVSSANEQEVFFTTQLPHSYKPGTSVRPHVHWAKATAGTGDVRWGLEYSWVNVGDTIPETVILYTATSAQDDDTALRQLVSSFSELTGTGNRESSMIFGRLFRNSSHADDTYTGDAALLEMDFHFQNHKLGTGPEFTGA